MMTYVGSFTRAVAPTQSRHAITEHGGPSLTHEHSQRADNRGRRLCLQVTATALLRTRSQTSVTEHRHAHDNPHVLILYRPLE
jgi:hypothetical protein